MPPPRKREKWRKADAIRFDPQPGPPPLRCPRCHRPTFPDLPGERACLVHGLAPRPLPPEYIARARQATANYRPPE